MEPILQGIVEVRSYLGPNDERTLADDVLDGLATVRSRRGRSLLRPAAAERPCAAVQRARAVPRRP
jgi:hypothetical protein